MSYNAPFNININYKGAEYTGIIKPSFSRLPNNTPESYRVELNDHFIGNIFCLDKKWMMDTSQPRRFIEAIGHFITNWVKQNIDKFRKYSK